MDWSFWNSDRRSECLWFGTVCLTGGDDCFFFSNMPKGGNVDNCTACLLCIRSSRHGLCVMNLELLDVRNLQTC